MYYPCSRIRCGIMVKKSYLVIGVVIAIIAAGIGSGVFYFVIWPKFDDDESGGGGGNGTNGGGNGNKNPVAVIKVLDDTLNVSINNEFAVGEKIWFDASMSQPEGNITRFMWEFGDGLTTDGPGEDYELVNHTYTKKGTFIINLTVIGLNNARDNTNVTVTILGEPYSDSQSENLSTRVGSSNATVSFPIEEDARNLTIDITASGISRDITQKLSVDIYNPYHELMDNTSMEFIIQATEGFTFQPIDISFTGNYFVELNCQAGNMRVVIDIYVAY